MKKLATLIIIAAIAAGCGTGYRATSQAALVSVRAPRFEIGPDPDPQSPLDNRHSLIANLYIEQALVMFAGGTAASNSVLSSIEIPLVRAAPAAALPHSRTLELIPASAVIAGLTRVDPRKYNGWKGACPGCDVDAHTFAAACDGEGVPYALLLNEEATRDNIVAAAREAVRSLAPGGLLILYISGHGGQRPAAPGNETDGKDETLCLYDGRLVDDAVWRLLIQIPDGIRVWMITDTCNSGTNYRSPRSYAADARGLNVALLHWGGCGDGQYSYGSAQGGHFTTALVDAWRRGQSYAAWFAEAKRLTPKTQVPTCEVVGDFDTSIPVFK
jgi:hypothetical protein